MFRNTRIGVAALALMVTTGAALVVAMGADGVNAAQAAGAPASTVSAAALPASDSGSAYAHRGAVVAASHLSVRSLVNGKDGFALASVGQAQYPAATTDGGRTWRIDGPHFHVDAANGPSAITRSDATGSSTYFAYGGPGGGNSVVVSTDLGRHWWRAYLPGVPLTVEPSYTSGKPALVTIVENNPGKFAAYLSTDGGRHWHHDTGNI